MRIGEKWGDAIHIKADSFKAFWSQRLEQKRDVLLIMGLGWDPRMTALATAFKDFGGQGLRSVHVIAYRPSPSFISPQKHMIEKNLGLFQQIVEGWATKETVEIITRKENDLYVGDELIAEYYSRCDLAQFTDIIVDVSSLPKSLYFTLLLVLVKRASDQSKAMNVHAVACQDVELDSGIVESAEDVRLLKGFRGRVTRLSQSDMPKIWAVVLGKNYSMSLRKLHDSVGPRDIYPILPFPARNPRGDDDILIEYEGIFVNEWNLNPMNFIYAVEDEPLDVYRSIVRLYQWQKDALEPLGDISMVVSALSSKLSSIGAFMAAFEGNMAVAHAIGRHNPPSYLNLDFWNNGKMRSFQDSLHSVWLTGEPYES
jgi:hypothetical protein